MALGQNNPIAASDVTNWYNSINSTISSFGGGIGQLSNPAGGGVSIKATDINNLVNKLNELKRDEYLSQVSYGSYSSVSVGQIIRASDWTGINSSISNLAGVKCRNRATNSDGVVQEVLIVMGQIKTVDIQTSWIKMVDFGQTIV